MTMPSCQQLRPRYPLAVFRSGEGELPCIRISCAILHACGAHEHHPPSLAPRNTLPCQSAARSVCSAVAPNDRFTPGVSACPRTRSRPLVQSCLPRQRRRLRHAFPFHYGRTIEAAAHGKINRRQLSRSAPRTCLLTPRRQSLTPDMLTEFCAWFSVKPAFQTHEEPRFRPWSVGQSSSFAE